VCGHGRRRYRVPPPVCRRCPQASGRPVRPVLGSIARSVRTATILGITDARPRARTPMKIAVVGAGFAGLASAKILAEFGHPAVVFDTAPDVGGVWRATRRYTGLYTQNNKGSCSFSDLPMPKHYPEWPSGEQVQAYLEQYVEEHGLSARLRLSTEVVRAELTDAEDGWLITSRHVGEAVGDPEPFDHLIVANGIFSDPVIPAFGGLAELMRAGGKVVAASQLSSVEEARGK